MRVLCVAEKPSAAKKIAEILSQSDYQVVKLLYITNYSRMLIMCVRDKHKILMSKITASLTT